MKYIILLVALAFELVAAVVRTPLISVNSGTATIKVDNVDVGMSGFIVKKLDKNHSAILKSVVVRSFNKESKIATLQISDFLTLKNDALPTGKWEVEVGDIAELTFGYTRALLISPNDEIYHKISKSVKVQWVHPDIFTTILSYNGHPRPLKEDFDYFSSSTSVGLLFIYLDKKLYTLDIKSFVILNISDAPLDQEEVKLPFYSRIDKISSNWFGEGSSELEAYEPYYYELLVRYNSKNKELYEIVKSGDKKIQYLLNNFEQGE